MSERLLRFTRNDNVPCAIKYEYIYTNLWQMLRPYTMR